MNREDLIKALKNCENNNTITLRKFCVRFDVESSEIYKHFGGMRAFRKACGIKFNWKKKNCNKNILIEELKKVYSVTGNVVSQNSFDRYSKYDSSDVCNVFGSWKNACKIANVPFGSNSYKTQKYNENCLRAVLNKMGVNELETEKSFEGLVNPKTNKKLRFDFYIKDFNMLIEVDGFTHFDRERTKRLFKEELDERNVLDEIKNEFAKQNNFNFVRVKQQNWDKSYLIKLFNLSEENSFKVDNNCETKIEVLQKKISREKMIELYENKKMSDEKIAKKYGVDYNLVYRLRKDVYDIKSRSCKEQKTKVNIINLIKCYFNDTPYRFMPEFCGCSQSVCYNTLKKILKENPSIADIKSLKKTGKASSGQSDLKVDILDRPPYISFADGNI